MCPERFPHNGSLYTITVKSHGVGDAFGHDFWRITIENCDTNQVEELDISKDLTNYIQSTYKDEPEVFLCGYAKSIIAKFK